MQALIGSMSFEALGGYLCRRVGEIAPEVIPSIVLADGENRLRPWAVSRLPAAYNACIDGLAIGEGAGSCGTAIWRGEPVRVSDISADPLWVPYKHLALAHGLRACWSYPIRRRDGSVAGAFAFYSSRPGEPTALHERIVDSCASLCTLAIEQEESRRQLARHAGLPGLPPFSMASERLLLGSALKQAIAGGELRLEYQLQVCADSGRLYGVEALARWRDSELGDVPPGRFIGLAEEIGEIEAIGRWALREACRQLAQWRQEGVPVPVVAVNLSPLNFRCRNLPAFIAETLREYGLPGECLTIEITESLTAEMAVTVAEIRRLGVGLSMDDFGTGFSSLSNLANLPVTEVKIDKSFIDHIETEPRIRTLVASVIGLGGSLSLTVVAEGVETAWQRRLLAELGCPVLQGYLFARPQAPQDVALWIRDQRADQDGAPR